VRPSFRHAFRDVNVYRYRWSTQVEDIYKLSLERRPTNEPRNLVVCGESGGNSGLDGMAEREKDTFATVRIHL
jgi:hypothetical protein